MTTQGNGDREGIEGRAVQAALLVISAGVLIAGLVRVLLPQYALKVDDITLSYFAVAAGLLVFRDVKTLAFGSYKIEFERRLAQVADDTQVARDAASSASEVAERATAAAGELVGKVDDALASGLGFGGRGSRERLATTDASVAAAAPRAGNVADDPWKGAFGGISRSTTRALEASVEPGGVAGTFRIKVQLKSIRDDRPLCGAVQFFLHPTFANDRPVVAVGHHGVAELALNAWGAFTIGAIADSGATKLELDLSELETAPREFREL